MALSTGIFPRAKTNGEKLALLEMGLSPSEAISTKQNVHFRPKKEELTHRSKQVVENHGLGTKSVNGSTKNNRFKLFHRKISSEKTRSCCSLKASSKDSR